MWFFRCLETFQNAAFLNTKMNADLRIAHKTSISHGRMQSIGAMGPNSWLSTIPDTEGDTKKMEIDSKRDLARDVFNLILSP